MSKRAKQELEQIVLSLETDDFVEIKEELADRIDVKPATAYQYIMDYCHVEGRGDDKRVTDIKNPSFIEDEDEPGTSSSSPMPETSSRTLNIPEFSREPGDPTGEYWRNLEVLEETDHPLIPEDRHYFERRIGEATDIDKLSWAMEHPDYATLLVGDAGVGKGEACKFTCHHTHRAMVRLNFGVRVTKEKLVGHYAPDGNGGFEWKDGILTKAVRHGWVFLADEINAAPPEALVALNGLLEDRGSRSLEIEDLGQVVQPHPEFKLVATMNPGYVGTEQMNFAFEDRFIVLPFDWLAKDAEQKLIESQSALDDEQQLETLVEVASDLRDQYPETVNKPVTTRALLKIGDMTEIVSFEDAVQTVLTGIVDEGDTQAVMKVLEMNDVIDSQSSEGLGELFG